MKAYSYHTFILPFIWERSTAGTKLNLESQYLRWQDKFRNDNNWEEMYVFRDGKVIHPEDMDLFYKEYKYFHPHICKSIYGNMEDVNRSGTGIVTSFELKPEGRSLKATYRIILDKATYLLEVDAIEVKLYNTGVGLYALKCANREKTQHDLQSVKDINDYGRRITLPVRKDNPVCARELILEIEDYETFDEDWTEIDERVKEKRADSLAYISKTVTGLLKIKDSDISLGIDDRMYVVAWVTDERGVKRFIGVDPNGYAFKEDMNVSKDMYELAAVDHAGDCTCQSFEMRKALLDKYVYQRWLDYGSIYTVAAQGLIAISTAAEGTDTGFIVENFRTQYYQMVCLCLAQRTSIINFSRIANRISRGIEENTTTLKRKDREEMMDLQERYIAFITQIDTTEASPEEQGIEMYNMIRSALNTETEKATLCEQLQSLSELADSAQAFRFNIWACVIAAMAFALTVLDLIWKIDVLPQDDIQTVAARIAIVLAAGLAAYLLNRRRK